MQLGFFPSYITLFVAGILAYRVNLLSSMSFKLGKFWLIIAFAVGIPLWFAVLIGANVMEDPTAFSKLFGGFHWQQAAYSFWESFFCVAMSTGLFVLFKEKFNGCGKLALFLKDNAFGVYVFHAPILVAITMALKGFQLNPVAKMYIMSLIVIPTTFILVSLIRKIPIVEKYFT